MAKEIKLCAHAACCGCGACDNACPQHCISMQEDAAGYIYPVIDTARCVHCGACMRACPELQGTRTLHTPRAVYSAWRLDRAARARSASGGVAAVLMEHNVAQGGVAFGASDEIGTAALTGTTANAEHGGATLANTAAAAGASRAGATPSGAAGKQDAAAWRRGLHHVAVSDMQALDHLRRSKYVQSYIGDTYREARDLLRQGRTVLFTGTPCQIQGLYSYLHARPANLYTVDLVCHGVPAQRQLREHLRAELQRELQPAASQTQSGQQDGRGGAPLAEAAADGVARLTFRDNNDYLLRAQDAAGQVLYERAARQDGYMQCFLAMESYRPSCYQCPYAQSQRGGDLTLGDFWRLPVTLRTAWEIDRGVSCVLVNTEQGEQLLAAVAPMLHIEPQTLAEARRGNGQLQHPATYTERAAQLHTALADGTPFPAAAQQIHPHPASPGIKALLQNIDKHLPKPLLLPLARWVRDKMPG